MNEKKVTKTDHGGRVTKSRRLNPLEQAQTQAEGSEDDYAALVTAAGSGNQAALERLLMRAQEVAWRFSKTVCGHADDAEDAMQEALIKTYRYVGRIREPQAFRPWLYRTVRNACLMSRRKKVDEPAHLQSWDEVLPGPEGPMHLDAPHPGKDPEQLAHNAALRRRLRKAMRGLPAQYRAIVFLREMEGLSTREVAKVMGISEDNVKTRLHRARVQLQSALGGRAQ
ncbi:MAG: RNA polymerase sigma factor [Vicinamibacterales bacterium]